MIENLLEGQVLSVTQANQLAKELLESVPIWVEGEAFDVRQKDQRYRYNYFYLKDPETEYQLPCIAEPYYVESLPFPFQEGSKYKMFGNLTLWDKGGKYQFSVRKIVPVGEGNLLRELEELKIRLQKEGLFDESTKKPLPKYPERIGVVTSLASGSAAWDDFRKNSIEVFPFLEIVVRDSFVQGEKAIPDVVSAISALDQMKLDVIVVTRGGGAMEDLMAFNSEAIARAIYNARTPVLSAIGHEKDFTIADLVADARASTPTNAAHLLTQNYLTLFERIDNMALEIQRTVTDSVEIYFQQLDVAYDRMDRVRERLSSIPNELERNRSELVFYTHLLVNKYIQQVDLHFEKLSRANERLTHYSNDLESKHGQLLNVANLITERHERNLKSLKAQLTLLSPESTLERGYSIVTDENGKLIRSIDSVTIDQVIDIRLSKGKVASKVLNKQHE